MTKRYAAGYRASFTPKYLELIRVDNPCAEPGLLTTMPMLRGMPNITH
jgi:hypothetical protein